MADQQILTCPECGATFTYDPNSPEPSAIRSLTGFQEAKKNIDVEVTIYLVCPNGHPKPYKVKKGY